MRVSIFVPAQGVIEGITPPFRTFNTANDFLIAAGKEPLFEVEYVGLTEQVSASSGEYMIKTHRILQDLSETDLLVIPPTFGSMEMGIKANAAAIPYFTALHQKGSSLASLCAGAFLLAETGLLSGKKCSTHWAHIKEFKERYPDVEVEDGAVITEHGNIYSSGGANSLWNLLLYLVEKYADRETAVMISKYFAIDMNRNDQSQFAIFRGQRNHQDEAIQQVQDYIEKKFEARIAVEDLASLLNIGRRTFERRFKDATSNTPVEYIQRVRVEAAKKFFEISRKHVSDVMYDVGYTDAKAFREIFKKITGLTPIEYRNRFSKAESSIYHKST